MIICTPVKPEGPIVPDFARKETDLQSLPTPKKIQAEFDDWEEVTERIE